MGSYEIGEKVRIIREVYGHGFEIGETVIIKSIEIEPFDGSLSILAVTETDDIGWCLGEEEIEKINDSWILDPLKEEE